MGVIIGVDPHKASCTAAVLGLVYVGGVVVFSQVLNPASRDTELAVAASTLVVAALFQPLRRSTWTRSRPSCS
jgi:hypothetical protein